MPPSPAHPTREAARLTDLERTLLGPDDLGRPQHLRTAKPRNVERSVLKAYALQDRPAGASGLHDLVEQVLRSVALLLEDDQPR